MATALSESDLSAILGRELHQAVAWQSSEISKEREDALKRYFGEPYGNEEEGRSQVVMRDVQEVVEWLLPALLKVFMSGDNVVEFLPRGPEDEEIAQQRTEYINYVFQQDNNGFLTLYTVFKDALIQKNGVVKVYYDDHALDEVRTVEGIDDDAYNLLLDDPDIEIIEHTEYPGEMAGHYEPGSGEVAAVPGPVNAGAAPIGALPAEGNASQGLPMASPTNSFTHDVKYRKSGGKVCIEAVPPENWLVSARTIEVCKSPYVADRKRKTISDLASDLGIDPSELDDLADGSDDLSGEAETRRDIQELGTGDDLSDREGVMREVWVYDHYILVDYDGDGIAERRRVVTAGGTSRILLNEEWEGPPPYASFSGILTPHRVIGQSIADQIADLQKLNTTLMRQMLDNLYLVNHPRFAGTTDVDQDDWYSPNPGQLVSTKGRDPSEVLMPLTVPFAAGATLPVMEFIATMRENRTGVTRYNQGIDANSLNKTASGITQIMSAAQQRVELMARVIAETGMKEMFKLIDHCVTRYQDKERVIRIRNQWIPVDPRQWESNFDMTINVGLGTGNKDQMLMHLQMIAQFQAQVVQAQGGWSGPLVTPDNIYETMKKIAENAGFRNPEAFFTDPKMAPPQQPRPDPNEMKVQADIAAKMKMTDAEIAAQAKKTEADIALKRATTVADYELRFKGQQVDAALAGQKTQSEIAMSKDRMNGELKMKSEAASSEIAAKSGVNIAQGFEQIMQALGQMAQQLSAQMQQIGQLIAAEKEVVRGPDGRALGVRIKQQPGMVQ